MLPSQSSDFTLMATQKQIQANRRNAATSTGPRTDAGKAISSQNALKSGIDAKSHIIRGEDPAELAALTERYYLDHQPQTADERALVDILIDSEWNLRRVRRVEAQIWNNQTSAMIDSHLRLHPGTPLPENEVLGRAYHQITDTFTRLERRREGHQRAHHRALQQLRQLQAARQQTSDPPELPQPSPEPPRSASSQKPNPTNGFVPENPPTTLLNRPAAGPHPPNRPENAPAESTPESA